MRPNRFHPLGERRGPRRPRRSRIGATARATSSAAGPAAHRAASDATPDLAVQRVRDAGGPVDLACYTCGCGYLFVAPVSTSVPCPHCGTAQAW